VQKKTYSIYITLNGTHFLNLSKLNFMAAEQSNHFTREQDKQERDHSNEHQQHAGTALEHKSKEETASRKDKRGFASMDAQLQKQIASKGGRAAHAQGVAHEFNSTEAREAGRKGGVAVSRNRQHMAEIGKKGGEAAHNKRKKDNSL
jgi:general stress protein YciG